MRTYTDADIELPEASSEPFFTQGNRGSALLLHGFTGTPYETRPVAQVLTDLGLACTAPCLPGHGQKSAAPINQVSAEDWLHASRQAFSRLPSDKPKIVVGVSMGALLAVELARQVKSELCGMVLFAPAFMPRLSGRAAVTASWLGLGGVIPTIAKPERGGDVGNPDARSKNPTAAEVPLLGLKQFDRLRQMALTSLPLVSVPTFIAHGREDNTIDPEASIRASRDMVKCPQLELHLLPHARHILPLEKGRGPLLTKMARFADRQVEAATPNPS